MRLSRRELLTAVSVAAVIAAFPAAVAQEHGPASAAAPEEADVARSVEMGGLVFRAIDSLA